MSELGPAAGPHTQLAQNLALCWLAGSRILELKTVQANDALTLSRPCIDMATLGYNTEWSQELRLADSLREYVKASMLIELLDAAERREEIARMLAGAAVTEATLRHAAELLGGARGER